MFPLPFPKNSISDPSPPVLNKSPTAPSPPQKPQESLRVYKTGFVEESHPEGFASQRLVFRDGDIVSPLIKHAEPLQTQVMDFINAIRTGSTPTSDCEIGRQVVRILEAGCESYEKGGAVTI